VAGGIAWSAARSGALSASGARAAWALGTIAALAGAGWAALLVTYFLSSSLLSRAGQAAKARRTAGVVAKAGARDARQVLANGGLFGLAAVGAALTEGQGALAGQGLCMVAAIGALGASAADTWATEIGTWVGAPPRSVRDWQVVPAGTSGAVSLAGSLGLVAGAVAMAAAGLLLLAGPGAVTTARAALLTLAAASGAIADTWVGATLQARRYCPTCDQGTEQPVHHCGTPSRTAGGLAWLDNDAVNLLATLVGAAVAVLAVLAVPAARLP
jgi:uncharacterized protein (TIGR00297 family)